MANLDAIQARLSAMISRVVETGRLSTQPGPGPDWESAADLAEQIAARLMQPTSHAEEAETPSTPTQPRQDKQEKEAMPHLTDEIKTFIVKGLACYDTPSQVAEAVGVEFDIVVSRQQVHEYDPGCVRTPALRWRELYAATRAALLRETADIGIAHRAVRLLRLDRVASRSERYNVRTALKCLEMAAKECGGMYERRRPIVSQPAMPQNAVPEPPPPQHVAAKAAKPQPAAKRPATPQPAAAQAEEPRPPAPLPPGPPPVAQQPSTPERAAPQVAAPQAAVPQPPATALSAPLPLAVPAQPPQPPALSAQPLALSQARPLSRVERHLAYVRDRHARDRAVAAQALLNGGGEGAADPNAVASTICSASSSQDGRRLGGG